MSHPDLSNLPASMTRLPVEIRRGLPVPLVNTFGFQEHDFTTVDGNIALKLAERQRCGICGDPFEVAAFLGGPQSADTKAYSDPPMHEACAEAAITLCPHIARKNMRRATDNHVRQDAITPQNMTLDKPAGWVMYVANDYRIFIDGPEGQQTAFYVPGDSLYLRTWRYNDGGQLVEDV